MQERKLLKVKQGQKSVMTIHDDWELEEIIGPVAMNYYRKAGKQDQEMIREWAPTLQDLSDEEFVEECAVRFSAHVASLEEGKFEAYRGDRARASVCRHEALRRYVMIDGHDPSCQGSTLFAKGVDRSRQARGYVPNELKPCTCETGA